MGSTFVTFDEAASLLKCSKRTIHNHINQGRLKREYENGKVVLLREQVEQLIDESPVLNNRTLLEILGRLQTIEIQMAVVRKMYGIEERPPLRPSPEEAIKLLENARYYLQKDTFTPPEIALWVSMFSRMDELTFDLMRRAGVSEDFWQDFFNLCLHLMDFVSDPKRCKATRTWLQYHLELTECRKILRSIILMWVELGRGKASNAVRRHLGGGKDDLIRRLKD